MLKRINFINGCCLVICFISLNISCNNSKKDISYYYGNNEVIQFDKNVVVYSIIDSVSKSFKRKSKSLVGKSEIPLKYSMNDSLLTISTDFLTKQYNRLSNKVVLSELEKCWVLDDSRYNIKLCFSGTKFSVINENELYEDGSYLVSNDFNTFHIFNTNSVKFFSDTFYIIDMLNDSLFRLVDVKSQKQINFTATDAIDKNSL